MKKARLTKDQKAAVARYEPEAKMVPLWAREQLSAPATKAA